MSLVSSSRHGWLRKNAPQLIVAAIIIVVAVYLLFELLVTSGPLINAIKDVTATVKSWGYTGIFLLMLLEASSLPIPSEAVLPFAGYLVSIGHLNLWATITVATIAGVAGSLIDYYIG